MKIYIKFTFLKENKNYYVIVPTPISASSGHSLNQSIVQQLINEGNILNLLVNTSPKGLMAIII